VPPPLSSWHLQEELQRKGMMLLPQHGHFGRAGAAAIGAGWHTK